MCVEVELGGGRPQGRRSRRQCGRVQNVVWVEVEGGRSGLGLINTVCATHCCMHVY